MTALSCPDQPLVLRPLPYPYDALAPALSAKQVRVHHELNQAAYVRDANRILAQAGGSWHNVSPALHETYVFNRNGAMLHERFWTTYSPGGRPASRHMTHVMGARLDNLYPVLTEAAMSVQGSGWAFLSARTDGELVVHTIPNHDYPWGTLKPLVVVDVWEHAFYLDYFNDRQGYLELLLPLIDWCRVEERLES